MSRARDGWVRPFLREHRLLLAIAVLLSVMSVLFASALMFTSGYMISLAATIPFTVLALHVPSIFVRIFGIGKPILQYAERLTSHDWVLRMTSSLRFRLYSTIEALSAESALGRMLGLFADDLEHLQNLCLRTIFPMIVISATYLIVVVAFGILSPVVGLTMLVCIGLAAFALPFWSLAANGASIEVHRRIVGEMYEELSEDVLGVVDWGLAGRRSEFAGRIGESYEEAYREARKASSFERRISILRQVLYCAMVVCVLAWASYAFSPYGGASGDAFLATDAANGIAGMTMHDSLPYAANWIAAFVLFMFPLMDSFSPATEAVLGAAEHKGALEELNGLDARLEDRRGRGHDKHGEMEPCADEGNAIELDGVTFAYSDGKPILEDASMRVAKGEHVALMGRSGAGKSTLLALMSGEIQPLNGKARRTGKVGLIEQFPYVFRKSLRENLLMAKPDATDEELVSALESVQLTGLLERLPDGLGTLMAEGGATLSGGERHRLAVARILLYDCDIVLLDEPYLGLDEETRKSVSDTLLDVLGDKSIVLVTHDSSHAEPFDRIVRVEGGKIV